MDQPQIVVTGLRHSGTTAMTRFLASLGFDLGDDLEDAGPEQGLEWRPLFDRVVAFSEFMGRSWEPDRDWWWRTSEDAPQRLLEALPRWAETFGALQGRYPALVKCPEMTLEWQWVRPRLIVVMVRDRKSWVESMIHRSYLAGSLVNRIGVVPALGYAHQELLLQVRMGAKQAGVPVVELDWPRAASDEDYLARSLEGHIHVSPEAFHTAFEGMRPTPPGQRAG